MSKQRKMSEVLFERYEYLAKKYASKIFSYEQLSYEYNDLLQELKIKIFLGIKAYGRAWRKFRNGESVQPMPLKQYLECVCRNKSCDFMKYISRENYKVRIDDINYDFGIESETNVSLSDNKFIINGVDLLEGLVGKERAIFSLYLRGYSKGFLSKVYYNNAQDKAKRKEILKNGDEPLKVTDIIELQKEYLISKYGNELRQAVKIFSSYSIEED